MIVLITACGAKKEDKPMPAGLLYKSSRIRYLYKQSKELGISFYILSAKYGLVHGDELIAPYEEIMTDEKCKELKKQIKEILKHLKPKVVIYYKGGAREIYFTCIKDICEELNIPLETFGFKIMGDINKLENILNKLKVQSG